MVSNDVAQGDVVDALLLTPKARLIAPLRVLRRGERRLPAARPSPSSARRCARRCCARASRRNARSNPSSTRRRSSGATRKASRAAREELDVDVEPNVDAAELERLRIEQGVPAWGSELDDSILPAEAGLDETHISFTKGCYPGQEPIARLHYRGHVNRRSAPARRRVRAARRRDSRRRQSRRPRDECRPRPCARLRARRRVAATRSSGSAAPGRGYTDRSPAPVAQGIERCPAEAEVACSNHAGRTFARLRLAEFRRGFAG